jgi:hypothetical protein
MGSQSQAGTGLMVRCFGAATSVRHRRVDRGVRVLRHEDLSMEQRYGRLRGRGEVVVEPRHCSCHEARWC